MQMYKLLLNQAILTLTFAYVPQVINITPMYKMLACFESASNNRRRPNIVKALVRIK